MRRLLSPTIALVTAALLASCPVQAQDQGKLKRGQAIVESKCASCHATGRVGASPNDRAPPLRVLRERYPLEHLAEALAEGLLVGHSGMPEFRFQPDEIDAILAYIASISPPR